MTSLYKSASNISFSFVNISFLLLPIALLTGPAIPDIILSIIALYFLVFSILKKKWEYYFNYFVIFFLIFIFYGIARSLLSEFPWYSLSESGSLFYFRYLLFILGVSYLVKKNPNILNVFMMILFLCLIVVSLDGIYQFIFGKNSLGFVKPDDMTRITGFFGDEAILGRYISYMVAIFLFLYMSNDLKNSQKLVLFFFLPIVLGTTFLSGDRAPLLRLILILSLFSFFLKNNKLPYFGSLFFTLIVSLSILITIPSVKSRVVNDSLDLIKQNQYFLAPYGKDYEDIFITSIRIGNLNPIFGKGPNAYKVYCDSYKITSYVNCSHSHNFYLQLFSEQGLLGLLFLLFFYVYLIKVILKKIINSIKKNSIVSEPFSKIGVVISLLVFFLPIIPNMSFYNNWNNVFLYIMIAIFYYHYEDNMRFKKNSQR